MEFWVRRRWLLSGGLNFVVEEVGGFSYCRVLNKSLEFFFFFGAFFLNVRNLFFFLKFSMDGFFKMVLVFGDY